MIIPHKIAKEHKEHIQNGRVMCRQLEGELFQNKILLKLGLMSFLCPVTNVWFVEATIVAWSIPNSCFC
jgi:hypothetical protein